MPGKVLRLDDLGNSEQAAIRAVLSAFRDRGWRDQGGAALRAVQALTSAGAGLSPAGLAGAMPDEFLLRNNLKKADVRRVFEELASDPSVLGAAPR
jgi:hypothetical protein